MGRSFVRRGALQATVAALAILAAEALSHAQYPPPVLERPLSVAVPGDLAEGKRLYNAQCALCHGVDGNGGYGPSLLRPTFVRPPTTLA